MENQRRFQILHIAVNHSWKWIVFYCQLLVRQFVQVYFVSKVCISDQICDPELWKFAPDVEGFLNVFGEFLCCQLGIFLTFWTNDDDFSGLEDHDGALGFGFPDDEGWEPFFVEPGVLNLLSEVFEVYFFLEDHFAIWDDILDDRSLTCHGVLLNDSK